MFKPKIFISYAHDDEPGRSGGDDVQWLSYVRSHLGPLERAAAVEVWADTCLDGSQDWEQRIFAAIEDCDIFILLVSRYSLNSDFITKKEVPRILARQKRNNSTEVPALYPIVLTPVGGLDQFDWLSTPNRMPENDKALSEYSKDGPESRDRVMAQIVENIRKLAKTLTAPASPAPVPLPTPAQNAARITAPTPLAPGRRIVDGYLDIPSQSSGRVIADVGFIERAVTEVVGRNRRPVRLIFGVRAASLTISVSSGTITDPRTVFASGFTPPKISVVVQPVAGRTVRYFDIRACDGGTLSGNPLQDAGEHGPVDLFSITDAEPGFMVTGQIQLDISGIEVEEEGPGCTPAEQTARTSQLRALAELVLKKHGATYELGAYRNDKA